MQHVRACEIARDMSPPLSINARIIHALYYQALSLSDEVRDRFTLHGRIEMPRRSGEVPASPTREDSLRLARSCEGLRTTIRMMHAMTWLHNHRAYLQGDISLYQLHRFGRLSAEMMHYDSAQLDLLDTPTVDLIVRTRQFYDRLLRIDGQWRPGIASKDSAVNQLREHVERRLSA